MRNPSFGMAPLDPRDHHHHNHRQSRISLCAKLLLYACLFVLLVTSVALTVALKGAQHANHELQQQILVEQHRYNRLKQEVAEEKVVIVDAEQKTVQAERLLTACQLELKVKSEEFEEADDSIRELNALVEKLKEDARISAERVSRGVDVIDKLTSELAAE